MEAYLEKNRMKRVSFFIITVLFHSSILVAGAPAGTARIAEPLRPGDHLPAHTPLPLVNAPIAQLDPGKYSERLLILNFWGTWCSPCIPEMDSLAGLQQRNGRAVRVVAVSNEPVARLKAYLLRKPSGLWLASDTAGYWYARFALNYVGQCVLVDRQHRVLAIVRTDSLNQDVVDRALRGKPIRSSGETGNQRPVADADLFGLDSNTLSRVTLEGRRPGTTAMGKTYPSGPFANRRLSWINVGPLIMYKTAFGIESQKQVVYEGITEHEATEDTSRIYCLDVVVPPSRKDSLYVLARAVLNILLPIKGRVERRTIDVYVLVRKTGDSLHIPVSDSAAATYQFSGTGFDGTGIRLQVFVDYLSNELDLPVVDETGLTGVYDVHTTNVLRSRVDVLGAVDKLGLRLERGQRVMDVLVLSESHTE